MFTAVTYSYSTSSSGNSALVWIYLAYYVILVIGLWAVFTKAGEQGWKALIPIYNLIVIFKIAGRPWWWIFLLLIPIVGVVVMWHGLSKSFGKTAGFTVGLVFLAFIFLLILGFGSARYVGPSGVATAPPAPPPPPPMPA